MRSFGVKVEKPTIVYGDNLGVIQSVSREDAALKKKHVAIAYHMVRETVAAGIILPHHVGSKANKADMLTKAQPQVDLESNLVGILARGVADFRGVLESEGVLGYEKSETLESETNQ